VQVHELNSKLQQSTSINDAIFLLTFESKRNLKVLIYG